MQHSHRPLAVALILAGLQAAACVQQQSDQSLTLGENESAISRSKPTEVERLQGMNLNRVTLTAIAREEPSSMPSQNKPARVERVDGTNLSRVILSAKAAERLDIQTALVRDELLGPRKRLVSGEVVARPAAAADGSDVWIRVALSPGDLRMVAADHSARVVPLAREADGEAGTTARAVKGAAADPTALHYAVESPNRLAPGQRVRVEVALVGAGTRKVVPHAAMLYDAKGNAWVYGNPEPLVFVRQPITVDYVDGDLAVLSDGPAAGTKVVAVGAAELFGTELGIGK